MKNKNIRNSLIIFVIFLSLGSHTYLNSISVPAPNVNVEMDNIELEEVKTKNESSLPDVKIAEKALNFIKNMLPIGQ